MPVSRIFALFFMRLVGPAGRLEGAIQTEARFHRSGGAAPKEVGRELLPIG